MRACNKIFDQQVSDIQKSNDQKRQWVAYEDALNGRLTFVRNIQKGTSPSSRAPGTAASVARPNRTSPELTQTRLLGIKRAEVPPLPPQPDPQRLSTCELEEGIRTADAVIRILDEVLRINRRALDDVSRVKERRIEVKDRLLGIQSRQSEACRPEPLTMRGLAPNHELAEWSA